MFFNVVLITAAMMALLAIASVIFSLILFYVKANTTPRFPREKHFQILVVGDIGRSPRMQYHAMSILRHGGSVDLIGYHESALHPDLQGHERLNVVALPPLPDTVKRLPFLVLAPIKIVWQNLSLFYKMYAGTQQSNWIMVQNPPSIPTLHTTLIMSVLGGSHVIIDWHNYGWSILATTLGDSSPLVWVYRKYETFWGAICATVNLTVTDAMARDLAGANFNIKAPILTLHDRPAAIFRPMDWSFGDRRMRTLHSVLRDVPNGPALARGIVAGALPLIVSSTSWTPDEDFGLFLEALVQYSECIDADAPDVDGAAAAISQVPTGPPRISHKPLVAVITGKGPQKAEYQAKIKKLEEQGRLRGARIITSWLPLELYAELLACADLGVCLHKSSSGVDLPMKVVDMFGAGLPVVAYEGYESFGELVKEGVNGCGFQTSRGLSNILGYLLNHPDETDPAWNLEDLRRGAVKEGSLRWDEEWDRVVGRITGMIEP